MRRYIFIFSSNFQVFSIPKFSQFLSIMKIKLLVAVLLFSLAVEVSYYKSTNPLIPSINTSYSPLPPSPPLSPIYSPAPYPISLNSNNSTPPMATIPITIKALVLFVLGIVCGTIFVISAVGLSIWFSIKYFRKVKSRKMRGMPLAASWRPSINI